MGANSRGSGSQLRDTRRYHKTQAQQTRDMDRRVVSLEASERHLIRMVQQATLFLDGVTLTSGVEYTPTTSPASAVGVANIQGVFASFWIDPEPGDRNIYFGSSDDTLSTASQRYRYLGGTDTDRQVMTQTVIIPVGNDGNIKILGTGGVNSIAYMAIFGYWI